MANKKITELERATPSTAATVVGEDDGVAKRFPVSSFGGGGGIIDVDTLPTENIDASAIYRVNEVDKADCLAYESSESTTPTVPPVATMYCEVVDELPETGELFVDMTTMAIYFYYVKSTGVVWGYLTEELQATMGFPAAGWVNLIEMGMVLVVQSIDEATNREVMAHILPIKASHLYIYENGWREIPFGFRIVHNPRFETITIIES